MLVAAALTSSSVPVNGTPSRKGVRTHRLRYHSARPSFSRMPWIIPSPRNQWLGVMPGLGLWPLRK